MPSSTDHRCRCGAQTVRGTTGRVRWQRCWDCGHEILAPAEPIDDWMTEWDLRRALRWAQVGG